MIRLLRQNIRMLKRQFPTRVVFKFYDSSNFDIETGVKTRTFTSVIVRKALFIPYRIDRKFVYDLAYIASNKNFTQGGYFNKRESTVVIENRDLGDRLPSVKDKIEIGDQIWEITGMNIHHTNVFTVFDLVSLEGTDNE